MKRFMLPGAAALLVCSGAGAQDLMIPDSGTADRIMLFSGFDGSLIDINWITDLAAPFVFTTPREAKVVGNEIWVSDQLADAIHRFDLDRNYLSSITAHFNAGVLLDNLRGFGVHGTSVYLTIDPSTAANSGVVIYNFAGTPVGFFPGIPAGASLFDVAPFGSDLLISSSATNNIERYSTAGAFLGNFQTGIVFPQQVDQLPDGTIIAVSTISTAGIEGVYHWNADGTLIRFIDTEPIKTAFGEHVPRAAWPLGDGNYLIASGPGVYKYNVAGNSFSLILDNVDAQFINPIDLADPCPADIDDSGNIDINDLLEVINNWGSCPAPCPPNCPPDVSPDCAIDINDLLEVINNWGPCQ